MWFYENKIGFVSPAIDDGLLIIDYPLMSFIYCENKNIPCEIVYICVKCNCSVKSVIVV